LIKKKKKICIENNHSKKKKIKNINKKYWKIIKYKNKNKFKNQLFIKICKNHLKSKKNNHKNIIN